MNKMEYMPVDCLQVPKVLFQMEKYKNLSNTAKILYSLFLDRLKFAVQNSWVDGNHAARAAHRPACPHAPYGRCGADERGLAMVSVYPLWKADDHTGQPRRGQDLLRHASCGGLHQPKALARYGDP